MQSRKANEIFEELNTLSSVEKYIDPETYIETGFSISVTQIDERKNYLDSIKVFSNETNSLYFCKERVTNIQKQTLVKNQLKTGTVFRTFSELDLFELQYIG